MDLNNLFTPVKITSEKWADKLLDGEIFLRPLYEFGSWGRFENLDNPSLNNSYRGDIHEGVSAVFKSADDSPFFKDIDPSLKSVAKNLHYVDQGEIKYMKILSLYCLEYDPAIDFFKMPDKKMEKFGDTAIIICNMNEFLKRFAIELLKKWESVLFLVDRVSYYNFNETRKLDPLFSKESRYAYQNELRFATGELKENIFARGNVGDRNMSLEPSLDRVALNIGSIRDIAIKLPIHDFISLNLPANFECVWPFSDSPSQKSLYELAVEDTRKQMSYYQTYSVKPGFSIQKS